MNINVPLNLDIHLDNILSLISPLGWGQNWVFKTWVIQAIFYNELHKSCIKYGGLLAERLAEAQVGRGEVMPELQVRRVVPSGGWFYYLS